MEKPMVAPAHNREFGPEVAAAWVERWDAQQEGYIADREERFAVLADIVAAALAEVAEPVIVDLGCGPGSLSARLATRMPGATFIGVDTNPLLLGLAAAHYGSVATWLRADLADPGWADALPPTIHAAVSTTALHWMRRDQLAELYRTLAARTAPGGVLANGDHLTLADQGLTALADAVKAGRAARTGVTDREDWPSWWAAVAADDRLDALTAERDLPGTRTGSGPDDVERHHGSNQLSVTDHVDLLRAAGYTAAAPLWQVGDDHIVVGLR
jgi:SAM-dependent methyltransferase